MNIIYIKKRRKGILDLEEDQNLGTPTASQNSGAWTLGNYGNNNVVIAMDIVFPSSPSNGCAAEKGGTGTGFWVGLRDSGTVFRVRGFTGSSLNTNTTVWVDITDFPTDGNTHTVVIEIRKFPARIRVWIDGTFKGEDNMGDPQTNLSWEGGATGSFLSGENVNVSPEPTDAWPGGTTGQIRLYQNARITYNVPDPITDQLVLDIDPRNSNSYPGSGSTIYDLTSNDYDGVLSGGAYYENSTYGPNIRVTGVDEYINFSSAPQFTTSSFTISCWFMGLPTQPDTYATIVTKEGSNNLGNYSFAGNSTSVNVRFGYYDGSNTQEVSNNNYNDITTTYWFNYTGVFTYNSYIPFLGYRNYLELYRNGYLIASNYNISASLTPATTTNNLALGYRPNTGDYAFNGRLGKFQIFNKALSNAEVLQNYNAFRDIYGV